MVARVEEEIQECCRTLLADLKPCDRGLCLDSIYGDVCANEITYALHRLANEMGTEAIIEREYL